MSATDPTPPKIDDAIRVADASVPQSLTPASAKDEIEMPKIIPFEQLARCGDEVWIGYEGQLYRLRRTKSGKLILTK
ncbi:MAG: hemin uptake protein HemP [Planctomycetota bacterium]